jgi:hypothetical protein
MAAKWKIFYTDETSLLWSAVAANGDPQLISPAKRVGVHSVIQEMSNGLREVIEQYHYIFSIRDQQWIGVGVDGLFDYIINDLDNVRCVLNGRASATDTFWKTRDDVKKDTDIVGGLSASGAGNCLPRVGPNFSYAQWCETVPFYSQDRDAANPYLGIWTENARHRAHQDRADDPHEPYGKQEFYH